MNGSGDVSTWDLAGKRSAQDTRTGALNPFEGPGTFSYTNGM